MDRKKSFKSFFESYARPLIMLAAALALVNVLVNAVNTGINAYRSYQERIAREKRHRALSLAFVIMALFSATAAMLIALGEQKKKNGGYIFNIFNSEDYDIVDADEEAEMERIMRGELDRGEDSTSASVGRHTVDVDDEESAEDFN